MEHLDEILLRILNKPSDKQVTIFDLIEEQRINNLDVEYTEVK
jgi:hypothetical protein|tara:strand:- start:210 stop:338 length:129 start_codon:yes stop_codon:yes gene_type:complete